MNRLSSRNNRLKFKTAGKLPIILEESIEYTQNSVKGNRRMSTCNRLDLQTLGISTDYAKKSPEHWFKFVKADEMSDPNVIDSAVS